MATESREPARFDRLREESIGLPQVLFQSITHMGPALAVAFSLLVGFGFAGPVLPLSVLLAIVVTLFIANSIGQLAKQMPSAGGLYTYASRALGARVGFMVGWALALVELLIAPSVFLITGNILQESVGGVPWWGWTIIAAAIVFALNYWGVRLSTNAGVVLGVIEVVAFAALAVYIIAAAGDANTLAVFDPDNSLEGTWSGVFKGVVFALLAFQGFEAAAPLGEEAKNPHRTIPLAVILSALTIGLFYLLCAYAAVVGWGFDEMASYAESPDPWSQLATRYWGAAAVVILFAIINSALGNANAGVSAATRIVYAMGRIEVLPRALGRTHPVHRTPYVAIVAQGVFALVLVLALVLGSIFGPVEAFSINATALTILAILTYVAICAGCPIYYLRERRAEFNPLLHGLLPVLGLLFLLAPLYYQFNPLPEYPIQLGNWFAVAWLVAGLVALAVLSARRPRAIAAEREVFVDREARG